MKKLWLLLVCGMIFAGCTLTLLTVFKAYDSLPKLQPAFN